MGITAKLFGDPNVKELKKLEPFVERTNALEPEVANLSSDELKARLGTLVERHVKGEPLDSLLSEAFALVREAGRRALGQRHFDVQLLGGIVLHQGKIAEMRTGEGKTLVATLPASLNALAKKGVHIVTVNDYLSRRDAGWMGPIYHLLGLSVSCLVHENSFLYDPAYTDPEAIDDRLTHLKPISRREAYEADITYGTNNEFAFDFLRDNLAYDPSQIVQRGHAFAIVDEVDSILIDEARTPLIISSPRQEATEDYYRFAELVARLSPETHYVVDEKLRAATLTDEGIHKLEELMGVPNLYSEGGLTTVHHLEQALRAHTLFKLDRDYVVRDGEVIIVDEFTGRLMLGRRYSEGLHQAIEAKEKVEIKQESQTLATISFQNYFRLYEKLAGMTGTAATEAEEFHKIYGLYVVQVPTNRPMVREDLPDRVYKTEEAKFRAVIAEIKARHEKGQPTLVGTVSIEKNALLSELLSREGIPHNVLNAKNHEKEAVIVAQAGKKGAVTGATNMAGRGVDIVLGGSPADEKEAEAIKELGGLHVVGTERHESRRIDNQLRGRAGRQGDPGSTQFFVSLEDDLMRIFGGEKIKGIMSMLSIPEDQPIESGMVAKAIESAQKRIEGHNFDSRKHVVEYDDVMNKQRQYIYSKRRQILFEPASLKTEILEKLDREVDLIVESQLSNPEGVAYDKLRAALTALHEIPAMTAEKLKGLDAETIKDKTFNALSAVYHQREQEVGEETARAIDRAVYLRTLDRFWVEHLDALEHLRESIGLRGYSGRDPLVEYKHEAHRMFEQLLSDIDGEIAHTILRVTIQPQEQAPPESPRRLEAKRAPAAPAPTPENRTAIEAEAERQETAREAVQPITAAETIGRNELCPCGSGLKYKKCGLINAPEHQKQTAAR